MRKFSEGGAESKIEGKEKSFFARFKSSNDEENNRNKRRCESGCLSLNSLSLDELPESRRCFSCEKSCKEVESKGEENCNKCTSRFRSHKERKNRDRRGCGIECLCFNKSSSKEDLIERKKYHFSHKKSLKMDTESRKEEYGKHGFSYFKSSNGGRNERCSIGSSYYGKTLKEHPSRKEEKFCFRSYSGTSSKELNHQKIISQKKKVNGYSKKRKENKAMCFCSFCCTKYLDERKQKSQTKCIFSCSYCDKSISRQNSLFEKRKGSLSCSQINEQPIVGNQLTTTMHALSLKSDKVISQAEVVLPLANENDATQIFTYKELATATKNFSEDCLLGSDARGRVFKGELKAENEIVAIKQLKRNQNQGDNEFLADVVKLSILHHPNLVKLLGYCAEEFQIILAYEFIPFGSLEDHLFDMTTNKKPLDWFTRMKIAAGAAKGLLHLHDVADPPIIYHNMKASNILLDENHNPKLSDFGLKRQTRVMGAYGCYAPEYAFSRQFTKTTDVYSFGVLLLELITGKKAADITRPKNDQYVAHWAAHLFIDKRKYPTMVDPLLNGSYPIKGLCQLFAIANMCLQYEAGSRPLMSDIVTALEYLIKPETDCSEPIEQSSISDQLTSSNHENFQSITGSSRMQSATMSLNDDSNESPSSDIESCGDLIEEVGEA